jgi:transcriptional regulator with XRE-family HTH domain
MVQINPQRLREARNRRLLTQKQAAHLAGLSRMTLVRLEAGLHSPQERTVLALARVYGCSPRALLKDGSEPLENEVVAKTA